MNDGGTHGSPIDPLLYACVSFGVSLGFARAEPGFARGLAASLEVGGDA
jgi:hypothetical protein